LARLILVASGAFAVIATRAIAAAEPLAASLPRLIAIGANLALIGAAFVRAVGEVVLVLLIARLIVRAAVAVFVALVLALGRGFCSSKRARFSPKTR
jgi:hypothetical protein